MKISRLLDQSLLGLVVITCLMIYLAGAFGYQAVYEATIDEIREKAEKGRLANEQYLQRCLEEQQRH